MSCRHRSSGSWIAALLLPGLLHAAGAFAEEARPSDPPPEPRRAGAVAKPQGPVGNRQPRASDVPANLKPDELGEKLEQINRSLDRSLQICRGC